MSLLQVRDCPEDIYRSIVNVAKNENRSISQQVIVLLKKSLGQESSNIQRRRDLLEKIGKIHVLNSKDIDSVSWIREDRDR